LGLLQPELYKKEMLTRQTSSDSSGTGEMEYCGRLHFALRYDTDIEGLVVKVTNSLYCKQMKEKTVYMNTAERVHHLEWPIAENVTCKLEALKPQSA
jgi:hypothetical protein